MISATMLLKININNLIANAGGGICYGVTDSLAPFPLNQLIQNIQCSINNNNITLQQADLFDILDDIRQQGLVELIYSPLIQMVRIIKIERIV
jgi:DNA gyrase/topoisomerase IV subunit A